MPNHDEIARRVTAQTPFASLRTTYSAGSRQQQTSTARTFSWVGRITRVIREKDPNQRMAFLYDVEPLIGGPSAPNNPVSSSSAGAANPVVTNVRLRQPYVGNIFSPSSTATGIIIAPESGALVSVEEDPFGWVITGFLTGPSYPFGTHPNLGQVTYNPGLEEVSNTLYAPTFIAKFSDIDEGDVILGRGTARVRFAKEGLLVGSDPNNCEMFRADGLQRYSRFVNLETRGPAYLSYRKTFLGSSTTAGFSKDQSTVHTDILDINPNGVNLTPYVVRQYGHVSALHMTAGRYAGEIQLTPTTTMNEQQSKSLSVIRETVVQPIAPATGTSADANELNTTSGVVYDFQVRADGSFHIRSGKSVPSIGASIYGKPTDNTLDLQFDSPTQTLTLRLGTGGAPLINVKADGKKGVLTVVAADSMEFKTPKVTLLAATRVIGLGALSFEAPSIAMKTNDFKLSAGDLAIDGGTAGSWKNGKITVPNDVVAALISLMKHTHNYDDAGNPAITAIPNPSP